jgi:hypothetical protein
MTMIQPLLVTLLVGSVLIYFTRFRSKLTDRVIVLVLTIAAIVLVAHPELATFLAVSVGVGRGVDFVIYLSLFGYGFILIILVSKIRDLEASLIELTRAAALMNARCPGSPPRRIEASGDPSTRMRGVTDL